MNDKGLEIMLMALFGVAGLVLLIAAFVAPYLAHDRVLAVIGGSLGVGFAVSQAVRLRRLSHHAEATVPVEARHGEPR